MTTLRKFKGSVAFSKNQFIETFGKEPKEDNEASVIASAKSRKAAKKRHSMFVRPSDLEEYIRLENEKKTIPSDEQMITNSRLKSGNKAEDSNNNIEAFTCGKIPEKLKTLKMAGEDNEDKGPSPAYRRFRRLSIRKLACRPRRNSEAKPLARPITLARTFSIDDLSVLKEAADDESPPEESTPEQPATPTTRPTALPGWLASLTPRFERKKLVIEPLSPETPEKEIVPVSKANTAIHKGYLVQVANKKDNGQKYWCVLQDSCIYMFNDVSSEFAEDVVALGGYHATNDSTFATKSKYRSFKFTLRREGLKTYQFKCKSQDDVKTWLEHIQNESAAKVCAKTPLSRSKSAREFSQTESPMCTKVQRSKSDLEKEQMDVVRARLLREVLMQQTKILKEKQELEKLAAQKKPMKSPLAKSLSVGMVYSHSEDFGYFSSYDTDCDLVSSESRDSSPDGGRSPRSLSTTSGESMHSLCSIPEEQKSSLVEVNPEILAEIEEFEAFTKRELGRSRSNNF